MCTNNVIKLKKFLNSFSGYLLYRVLFVFWLIFSLIPEFSKIYNIAKLIIYKKR